MSIKLVASDLDGTIIDKNHKISEKNLKAISKIKKHKLPFVICTGKSYAVSKEMCKKFNAAFGIFGNGTQIMNLQSEKELWKNVLTKENLLFIITLAKRYHYHVHLYTETHIITEKLEFMDLRNYKIKKEEKNTYLKFKYVKNILDYIAKNNLCVYSAIVSSGTSSLSSFRKLLTINPTIACTFIKKRGIYHDKIINKDYEYINITPANINKNEALKFLINYLKIDSKDVLAIGDNINDYEMIQNAGIGVAVNEALEDLKKVATYVTKLNTSEGAFAEAIDKYI